MKIRKPQDQGIMKLNNKKIVLDTIRQLRPISRIEIAKRSGMSPTSITRLVSELFAIGLIRETEREETGGVGRKAILLDIVPDAVYTLGIHLDISQIKLCLVDFDGNAAAQDRFCIPAEQFRPDYVVGEIYSHYRAMIREHDIDEKKVIAVGVGSVGLIDRKYGILKSAPQLHWHEVNLKKLVWQKFGLPVIVENDIKAAARGEIVLGKRYGEDMAFLGIGSGVGSALISGGELMRGIWNGAGEIGHIVVDVDGLECDCGQYGCLQTYIAEWALVERARRYMPQIHEVSELFREYEAGKGWAVTIINQAVDKIAEALCILVCMYNPNTIVIGGKTIEEHPKLFDSVINRFDYVAFKPMKDSVKIMPTQTQGNATVVGCAILALDKYLDLNNKDIDEIEYARI